MLVAALRRRRYNEKVMEVEAALNPQRIPYDRYPQIQQDALLQAADASHVVQFYESDELLLDLVTWFVDAGLASCDPVVVIATAPHRQAIGRHLAAEGFAVDELCETGQLMLVDASETLARFMVGGAPDPLRFRAAVGGLLERSARQGRNIRVRAYGEMVDVLWRQGATSAAIQLEELWNELARSHAFSLLCAYAMGPLYKEAGADAEALHALCRSHTHLLPSQNAPRPQRWPADGAGGVQLPSPQARQLQAEIEHRKEVEAALRDSLRDLRRTESALRASQQALEDFVGRLTRATAALSAARTQAEVFDVALEQGAAAGARSGEVYLVGADGRTLELARSSGAVGDGAGRALPLVVDGRLLGELRFGFEAQRSAGEEAQAFLAALAHQCAQALERAQLYDAARQARLQAESADRRKDEFLAMLGHELRNPLAPILTALQLMQLRGGNERELGVIDRQVRHLVGLVDDLLDVSRITRGQVELDKERVEVSLLVARAIELASPLLEQRGHMLDIHVPRTGLLVDADLLRITQVLVNLVNNAAKYTDPGGQLAVTARRDGGDVLIVVKDNGIGMTAEMLPRVFDLFVQGERNLDRSQGGLGIGLTLARILVELHGGTITAHSGGPGTGSELLVRLPAPVADGERSAAPGPTPVRRSSGRRILVVDDNCDAAELLGEALRAAGHEVAIAHDGPQALAIAPRFGADIALLDIGLPVMDGYELADRLRALPAERPLRLIAITGYGQEADRDRSQRAGFDRHLVKPVRLETLMALVDEPQPSGAPPAR